MREQHEVVELFHRQSLRATVARACRRCGAPGYWHDVPDVNPGCFDPAKVLEAKSRCEGFAPVGKICPQCGADRDDPDDLGEIWVKTVRAPTTFERLAKWVTWRFR